MDGAVDVRERANLLAPRRGRKNYISKLRGLGEEEVLDDDEAVALGEDAPDPLQVR